MVGDVAMPISNFPFPLSSPSKILLGKELRPMALPAKSWPRASDDWITWWKDYPLISRNTGNP